MWSKENIDLDLKNNISVVITVINDYLFLWWVGIEPTSRLICSKSTLTANRQLAADHVIVNDMEASREQREERAKSCELEVSIYGSDVFH